jgi:Flp pilus assembly protein TadD
VRLHRGRSSASTATACGFKRLDPRNVLLLSQHAISYSYLRRFPEALRKFNQVLDIVPGDVDTLAAKAGIAQAEGDLPQAAAILAPLHPAVDDNQTVATQIYQARSTRSSPCHLANRHSLLREFARRSQSPVKKNSAFITEREIK